MTCTVHHHPPRTAGRTHIHVPQLRHGPRAAYVMIESFLYQQTVQNMNHRRLPRHDSDAIGLTSDYGATSMDVLKPLKGPSGLELFNV